MLELEVHQVDDTRVVVPAGELDLATAPALGSALAAAAAEGAARVVLDLRQLTFVDSSGIGVIIKLQRYFAVEGVPFGVVKGDDRVQRAFHLARVEPLLPWTDPPVGDHAG